MSTFSSGDGNFGKTLIIKFNGFSIESSISIKYLKLRLIRDFAGMGIIAAKDIMDPSRVRLALRGSTTNLNEFVDVTQLWRGKIHQSFLHR